MGSFIILNLIKLSTSAIVAEFFCAIFLDESVDSQQKLLNAATLGGEGYLDFN